MDAGTGPRLAVFDLDGTLVDSQHVIGACMNAAFTASGLPAPPQAEVRRVIGLPLVECMARLAPGQSPARHAALTESYREAFFRQRQLPDHEEPLFDGARQALDAIAASGYLLGIATGKARRGLLAVLDRHGLTSRFITLQTADSGPGKPHPEMLHRAMADTGAAPAATVMIGDTSFDMAMARAAGVRAVGVAWGYHASGELLGAGAHAIVASFAELPVALRGEKGSVPCG
jgi:phosphoglycolate phosphatase